MSKTLGNVVTPMPLLEKYTADGARYWAACARLGADTAADEKVFKVGKRLQTKLYNAGKFVLAQEGPVAPLRCELDRAFAAELRRLAASATRHFEAFQHDRALAETETFFWSRFTDTYIELAKLRARDESDPAGSGSAVAGLRLGLSVLLRLFAPFLPYITEEVWSWAFAEERGEPFIHRAPWPGDDDFADVAAPDDEASFQLASTCWNAINKAKADAAVSMGREIEAMTLAANAATLAAARPVLADVLAAVRCREHRLEERAGLEDGSVEVVAPIFAERPNE